ncbi:thiopeptide-type bacteriocin biosynthesis protein [Flavobacterium sp. LC2016-12]|uniref:thiopeptide-type bacteriocin biosynthesis protein n=1 Tax=Flavobacterium sp. LC2016-12 TaxID=2783794 RepID=UPI00188B8AEA|nr:thiopeptide-type bacteriocin biosynthesis protein [Flavobacterium sp. LC2016-12]MBF4466843.1 thiopeptide-type bacteriocin biosynthesis protein [Flavobacterium sp. LC2016-12]
MQRNFCLGSEWLYYKIYTGAKTTDVILLEKLYPVIQQLKQRKIIQKWFFIRYKDSDTHFRVRFLLGNKKDLSKVIDKVYPIINDLLQENLAWKIQTDTYKRELERYGEATMEDSEFLFWKDSEMMIKYLSVKKTFQKKEMALLFSLCSIDSLLNSFSLSASDKFNLMYSLQHSFKEEFEADKILKKELDKKYRELSNDIKYYIKRENRTNIPGFYQLIEEKQNQTIEKISEIKNAIQIDLYHFLASHIHMMINRQFSSKQRMHELIIYDHLYRYYKTLNYEKNKFF